MSFKSQVKQRADELPAGYQNFRQGKTDVGFLKWAAKRPEPIEGPGYIADIEGCVVKTFIPQEVRKAINKQLGDCFWQDPNYFVADEFKILQAIKIIEKYMGATE